MRFVTLIKAQPIWSASAVLWTAVCLCLLVCVLLLLNGPHSAVGDAEVSEMLWMMILSFPSGSIAYVPLPGLMINSSPDAPLTIIL